jgi:hypothetical protein
MIPKQHVPDLIRDVKRFSDKIMPKEAVRRGVYAVIKLTLRATVIRD